MRMLIEHTRARVCAGVLAAALGVTSVAPGAAFAADEIPADVVAQPGDDADVEEDDSAAGPDIVLDDAEEIVEQVPEEPAPAAPAPATPVADAAPPPQAPATGEQPAQQPPPGPAEELQTAPLPAEPLAAPVPTADTSPKAGDKSERRSEPRSQAGAPAPVPIGSPQQAPRSMELQAAPVQATGADAASAQTPVAAPPAAPDDAGSGKTYVVKAGDSLWSIAQAVLGSDAGTDEVSRYVARLWELNAERIGTGDPGLIRAGQTLLLP